MNKMMNGDQNLHKHQQAFKMLSLLLDYPEQQWMSEIQKMKEILFSYFSDSKLHSQLESFFEWTLITPIIEREEMYVSQIDRSHRGSFYLFEHLLGESRDRGGAMVSLREYYFNNGYEVTAKDLPDYLPLMLEFMSCLSTQEAKKFLAQFSTPLTAMIEYHHQQNTAWSPLLSLLAEWNMKQGEC